MPVKILSQTYNNPFKPSSTTNWPLGNVGDWQRLTLNCQFAVEKQFEISDALTISDPNKLILNDGSTWGEYGFAVGMECNLDFYYEDISVNPSVSTFNRVTFIIGNITGDTLEANDLLGIPKTTWGYQYGQIAPIRSVDYEINRVLVFSDQFPQSIEVDFTHVKNSQSISGNLASFIDGSFASFRAEETDLVGVGQKYNAFISNDFDEYLAFQSGSSVEKAVCVYVGATGHKKNYDIIITFMLPCFFDDSTTFAPNKAPLFLLGTESITNIFRIRGYPVNNNPNVVIQNDPKDTVKLGNVGWFNENYNQQPNVFTNTTPTYENLSGTSVVSLDYGNPTKVQTTISGINNLSGSTRFQYGFIWWPLEEEDYKETAYPFHENCKVNTGGRAATLSDWFPLSATPSSPFPAILDGYSSDGAEMQASDVIFEQNGTDVDVSITLRPNAAFQAFFDARSEQDKRYKLWVSVADQTFDTNDSDRVSQIIDSNVMQTYIEPIGLYEGLTIDFLDHSQDDTDTPVPCGNFIFVEDDLLAKVSFREETATGAGIPTLNKITFGVLVENATTAQQYVLDANSINMTNYPDPTQYNFSQSRGFKLVDGQDKNFFKLDYDATNDSGTALGVLGWYGFKVRWEDWIKRLPTPPNDFYNNAELENGLNNDWYQYFANSDWSFYFYVDINADLDGTAVKYQNLKEMALYDYDSNTNVTTEIKYYRDNNGVKGTQLLGGPDPVSGLPLGVIPTGETVWLDIEYTRLTGTWASVATSYGINCCEVDKGAGQKAFRQLSSIVLPEVDNPVIPIPANTNAVLTLVSSTVIRVETRIDSNKLIQAPRYKISGRLGCDV